MLIYFLTNKEINSGTIIIKVRGIVGLNSHNKSPSANKASQISFFFKIHIMNK